MFPVSFVRMQEANEKLIQFDRLFINDDRALPTRHVLLGRAYGLGNTVVPFPQLSNLLIDVTSDSPTELTDALKSLWLTLVEQVRLDLRTLNGLDGLLTNV